MGEFGRATVHMQEEDNERNEKRIKLSQHHPIVRILQVGNTLTFTMGPIIQTGRHVFSAFEWETEKRKRRLPKLYFIPDPGDFLIPELVHTRGM